MGVGLAFVRLEGLGSVVLGPDAICLKAFSVFAAFAVVVFAGIVAALAWWLAIIRLGRGEVFEASGTLSIVGSSH